MHVVVGLFCDFGLGWATSCCTEAQVLWVGESGLAQLQLTSDRLVHKLCPFFVENFGHVPMAGKAVAKELWQTNAIK